MKRTLFRLLTIGCTILAVGLFAGSVRAQGKGKGGNGGGGDPTPPPVIFKIESIPMPTATSTLGVTAMNNGGQVVGSFDTEINRFGFIYDSVNFSTPAVDLNSILSAPEGWTIASAQDINEDGMVVGYLAPEGPFDYGGDWLPFAANLFLPTGPQLIVLPNGQSSRSMAAAVNDDGDIVITYKQGEAHGVMVFNPGLDFGSPDDDVITPVPVLIRGIGEIDINNSSIFGAAQIAGVLSNDYSFRVTVGSANVETFPAIFSGTSGRGVNRINDFGVMAGTYSAEIRKNKFRNRAFRYDDSKSEPFEWFPESANGTYSLNNAEDFVIWGQTSFYHEGTGFIELNSTSLIGDSALITAWDQGAFHFVPDISERGALSEIVAPDYPAICGSFVLDGQRIAVLLTPVSQQ